MNKRGKNLALEIGVLEAKKGIEPSLPKCKNIAYERTKRNRLSTENLDDQLECLRQQRLSKKIHSVKKHVQRAAKKAKTFSLRKTIKKLKESTDESKRHQLEEKMKDIKALNPVSVSTTLFVREAGRLQEFADKVAPFHDTLSDNIVQEKLRILEGNALRKALYEIFTDLQNFLRNLYRSTPIVTEPRKDENVGQEKSQGDDGTAEYAVSTSNGERRRKPNRLGAPLGEFTPQPEQRNRKGQRARRAEWERMYGSQAKHLQGKESVERNPRESIERSRRDADKARKIQSRDAETGKAKPLHPSWEAKRRQAQALKVAAQSAPLHKKIKFADEGDDE